MIAASCDLGPDYEQPTTQVVPEWQQSHESARWPSADWWRGFGSSELDALIAEAQKANYDLAAAVARVREADAQVRIAGAPLLPTINANAGVTSERLVTTFGKFSDTPYQIAPSASYVVDFWGKNEASLESAKASAHASRYDQQVISLTIVASVANTYFQTLALDDRLRVAEQNLANAENVLSGIVAERRAGTATELDVRQQETVVAAQRAVIPPLEQQLAQNINALAILIGEPPEQATIRAGSLAALTVPAVEPGLPAQLLAPRPDVSGAEAQLVAANANIKVARAQFFPNVTLTAEGGFESFALATLLSPAQGIFTLAASAVQPIFTGGNLPGQLDLAKARHDELVARRKTAEQITDQQETVLKARDAYRIADAQFRAGVVSLLTVLTTENALFPAEDALVQDRLANLEAVVALFQALGGGWTGQQEASSDDGPR
ncbi:MAG TPA: efflux transporter outer membrane subunit [Stellaceae bacterium]|nr:efflux transporter outer membrane subunit [Stellaceae bacterium]